MGGAWNDRDVNVQLPLLDGRIAGIPKDLVRWSLAKAMATARQPHIEHPVPRHADERPGAHMDGDCVVAAGDGLHTDLSLWAEVVGNGHATISPLLLRRSQ